MQDILSRRKFLGQASCAAIGSTTMFSTLFNLQTISNATAFNSSIDSNSDYKALVCILNEGGLDAFNMLIPYENTPYNLYRNSRSNMALNQSELLQINPTNVNGERFGLHPSMTRMREYFNSGRLAFVSNVGTLVRKINKQQFYAGSVPTPLGLYSHSDQQIQWQTGIPHERSAIGWGGKISDMLSATNQNNTVSMNISLGGSNIFQTGNETVEYSMDPEHGSVGIREYYENNWSLPTLRRQALDKMVNATYENIFKKTYVNTVKKAIDGNSILTNVLNNAPVFMKPFDQESRFAQSLEQVAKTISGRDQIGHRRQIFFINSSGWDHHDELLNNQSEMLQEVDSALYAFQSALDQMGVSNQVTTFSLSEFSRTLTSNGNGTDHAWGTNVFALGGAVNGNRIYGQYPILSMGNSNPLEIGGGVLIPTTSADEYFAELALWFGVPPSELSTLFPNISYFYNTSSGTRPIGFLNS